MSTKIKINSQIFQDSNNIYYPKDESEVSDLIRELYKQDSPTEIIGNNSKSFIGNKTQSANTTSLSKISGIIDYRPEELYIKVKACTPINEIEQVLSENNQELAFEPIDFGYIKEGKSNKGTIAGYLSCNYAGSRRFKVGSVRDHVLGFKGVNGKGDIIKSSTKYESLYKALVLGLRDYVKNNKFPGVILGMSGGIDSALVSSLAVDALGPQNVHAVMMPSPYTSNESLNDAKEALNFLDVDYNQLNIEDSMKIVDKTLLDFKGPDFKIGITEENIQSRLRGLLLMALSNRFGYMLLATGNKSEYAVGYATLYGDMCGGYAPIKDVWKTDVFELCKCRNNNHSSFFLGPNSKVMPDSIINKPPTAELRDNQKDTDSLPDYNILDEILRSLVEKELSVQNIVSKGFNETEVKKVSRLLSIAEYKRFQSAPGPKVTDKAFGRDRRFPLTSGFSNWN